MKSQNQTVAAATTAPLISSSAGLGVAGIGLVVLAGWGLGIELLKRVVPGWAVMTPNSALAFVLCGTALWLLRGKGPGLVKRALAYTAALAALILGALTLTQYLSGIGFGLDEMLFKVAPEPNLRFPGRMPPAVALNFVMLGAALLILNRGLAQWVLALALAAGLSAFLAFAGSLYDTGFFYGLGNPAGMAIHTSIAFFLLTAGVAAGCLQNGLKAVIGHRSMARILVRRWLPAATQSANDAIISADNDGNILSWNDGARRIFGYTEEEVLGKPLTLLKAAPDAMVSANEQAEIVLVNAPTEQVFGHPREELLGRRVEMLMLEHERDLLSSLMDNVPDRIYFKDRDGRFLRNNRAHLARFGLSDPAQALGKSDFDFFPREHAERARDDERQVMSSGELLDQEERIDWPDGRVEWALVTKMPLRDAKGKILGTFGISHDITHRKRAEEELKSMSDRLLLATSAAAIGIWDFDFEMDRLIWDSQMFRIYGVGPESFSGTFADWEATVHPDDLPRENEKIQRAVRGEGVFDSEFRVVWPDQSIRHVKADAIVVRDSSGKPLRIIGTNQDITDQRRAEDDLKRVLAELERSNTELEQFAYVASHDLQEPLRAVTGCVQLLQKSYGDKLEADAGELIRHAVEGAARMRKLIDDLLAFSRVGTHGKALEPTDCNAVLELALANLTTALDETHALVTHDPLPTVTADPSQMLQLFQNLIGNAVKFHGERRPEIHVGAKLKDRKWLFSVRDNGIGIEPQYHDRIFVIFQRLHTRTEYTGTGVGLAICKRIVERHGGDVWVESEPGKGATVYFTIPEKGNHAS
jgi:PAS domain S-box-containing protein